MKIDFYARHGDTHTPGRLRQEDYHEFDIVHSQPKLHTENLPQKEKKNTRTIGKESPSCNKPNFAVRLYFLIRSR